MKFMKNKVKHTNNTFQSLSFINPLMNSQTTTLIKTIYYIQQNQNYTSDEAVNITIVTAKRTLFVAHLLYKALTEGGFDVEIEIILPEKFGDNLHIIICPQIFERMPDHYIAFQMEQLASSQWFDERYFTILKNSIAIFDYSIQNIEYLQNNTSLNKPLFFLPISSFEGYQEFLIHQGAWDGSNSNTCDVLFYGEPKSERRQNYLRALQERFSVKTLNEVFENDLYRELFSAKVIVNIHFYENALLETTRIYECLSLGLNVVSEESSDMEAHSTLLEQVNFVPIGDIEQMIESIEKVLEKEEKEIISVVIPCYNQAEFLDETVQSLLEQSYKELEIIIVNDGSTDNSRELIYHWNEKYPDKIRLIEQENRGLSEARNSGIRAASGNYLFLLDADDKLHKTMISKCMNAIAEHDADIIYADYQRFGETDRVQTTGDKVELYALQYANVTGATALYKKEVWEKTGGYKQNMHGGYEDWEFWLNASKRGFKFYHISEVLFYYRVKKESMYTDALAKHAYLCSKIVINHSELYTDEQQDDAIKTIKAYENLADLYFYFDANIFSDEKGILSLIGRYIHTNKLNTIIKSEENHIISSTDKFGSLALCTLASIDNKDMLEQVLVKPDADHVVFYSKLKYNMRTTDKLKLSNFAWSDKKGIVLAEGTSFPFVLHDNSMLKIAAYKRSEQCIQEKYQGLEAAFLQKDNQTAILEAKIKEQEEQLKRLRDELTFIYTSNTWRYTRIIRQLSKKLRINKKDFKN
ncbi:MAG: glycosyltransferase family 2 protein [Thiohalomonas sp.]|nr:glycosyltransferase family 2 protein [Thiohalomonas sp.]